MDSQIQKENFIKSKLKENEYKIIRFYNLCEKLEKILKENDFGKCIDYNFFFDSLFYLRIELCNLLKIYKNELEIENIINNNKDILRNINNKLLYNSSIFSKIINRNYELNFEQKNNWLNLFFKSIDIILCEFLKTLIIILNPVIINEYIKRIIIEFENLIPYTDEIPSEHWINIFNEAKDKYNVNVILSCLKMIEKKNNETLLNDVIYIIKPFESKIITNKNKEYIKKKIINLKKIKFNNEIFNLNDNISKKNLLISILEKHSVNPLNLEW